MKGTLPTWIEQLLGLDSAASGEGTAWSLDHAWAIAPWISLVLIAGLAVMVVACYARERVAAAGWQRWSLAAMRLAALGIVLFMIAEFVLSLKRTGLPYLVVAIDDSASMSIADRYQDEAVRKMADKRVTEAGESSATRLALAKSLLLEDDGKLLRQIDARYKLRLYFVSDAARGQSGSAEELLAAIASAQPTGSASRLGQGVRTILNDLRGAPPSAILLLTDGVNTDGETLAAAAAQARRKGVPLFTVAVGDDRPSRDLDLDDLLVDEVVFVDDVVNFEFKLTASGFAGKQAEVVLHEKGKTAPLAKMTVNLGPDGESQKVRLPYRPTQVGEFEYVVEVQNLPDELRNDNNRQERLVSVRKEQVRVLLAQGYPNYEFRYLKHLLERDSTVQVRTYLQEADQNYASTDQSALASFPVSRDELFAYDVIIFGDLNPTLLGASALQHLADFVTEKGGGVVFTAGPRFMPLAYRDSPLAPLLPIEFDGAAAPPGGPAAAQSFPVQPTELGLASPTLQLGDTLDDSRRIWSNLPPLYWLFEAPALKPAARVLAEHPARTGNDGRQLPVICLQYVGAGKVVFHAVDETWRWRYRVGDVFFARYWVQTIRYLSRSKLLGKDRSAELVADRREYRQGESPRLRVRFVDERLAPVGDDAVTLVIEQEGGQNRKLQLRRSATGRGIFEGTLTDPPAGKFHAWLASPTLEGNAPSVDFLVAAPPGEFEHTQADVAELQRAAGDTKGKFYTLATVDRLRSDLPEGRQVPIESLPPIVLWNKWPLLLVCLALLVGEWIGRKRLGML